MKDELYLLLKQHWKVDAFRPQQYEICQSILSKRDSLVLVTHRRRKVVVLSTPLPCYSRGLFWSFLPLISLMQDQVAQANARGIKSMAIG